MIRSIFALFLVAMVPTVVSAQEAPTIVESERIEKLIKQLGSLNLSQRIEAANALGEFGFKARDAMPKLIELIENDWFDYGQRSAIEAMVKIGGERAIATLRYCTRKGNSAETRRISQEYLNLVELPTELDEIARRLKIEAKSKPRQIAENLRTNAKSLPSERALAFQYLTSPVNSDRLTDRELATMLDDVHPEFRDAAAKWLLEKNPELACRECLDRIRAKPKTVPDRVRTWLADSLASLNSSRKIDPKLLESFIAAANQPDDPVRMPARTFLMLGDTGPMITLDTWKIWLADKSEPNREQVVTGFLKCHSRFSKLDPEVVRLVCDLANDANIMIRNAAFDQFTSPAWAKAVPLEFWKSWFTHKSDEVRALALVGLRSRGDPDAEIAKLLDGMKNDTSPKVKAAFAVPLIGRDAPARIALLMREETDAVAYFNLAPGKKISVAPMREYLKLNQGFKKFEFDPQADVYSAVLSFSEGKSALNGLVLHGRFQKDKLNRIEAAESKVEGVAKVLADSIILTGETNEAIQAFQQHQPPDATAKLRLAQVIPKDPEAYLMWVVLQPSYLKPLANWINLDRLAPNELLGIQFAIESVKGDWKVSLTLPNTADKNKSKEILDGMAAELEKALQLFATFIPELVNNNEACTAFAKAMKACQYEIKGNVVSASVVLDTKTLEAMMESLLKASNKLTNSGFRSTERSQHER